MVGLYNFVTVQYANAGLVNVQLLLSNDAVDLTQLLSHTKGMVKRWMVWFATFLGDKHPLVEGRQLFLEQCMTHEVGYKLLVQVNRRMLTLVPTPFVPWSHI